MKKKFLIMLLSFSISIVKGQSLAINNDGSVANNSAILDVKSTTKGLLIPRMSKVQRTAITSPSTGLLIYQNAPDSTGFYYYDGASWQWLSTANDNNNNWKLTGNSGTQPYLNFLGTSDLSNLTIKTNNADRVSVTTEAEVGIGTQLPYYTLDIITGTANINNCEQNGIRVRTAQSSTGACEAGLFMGYTDLNTGSNEGIIRNYGQQANGVKTLAFGVGPVLTMMRLTSDGLAGIGSGTLQPQYGLDVTLGIAAVSPPCGRNGLRLNPVGNNACESGVFLGYDSIGNYNSTSLWNFSADNSGTNSFIRFGFGTNFSQAPATGEAMRILPPGKGVGINQINPVAMLHISNYTGSGVLPGVMITNPTLPPNSNGFYSGLKLTGPNYHEGYIWNYQNAATIFGTNDLERMRISENGNIGINTTNPIARLHVADSCVVFSANGSPIYPASPSPITGPGRRMLWYADKAAFRAGYVDGVQWDTDSIGVYSFAVGYNTKAKDYSTALGTDTKASNGSLSTGAYSTASWLIFICYRHSGYSRWRSLNIYGLPNKSIRKLLCCCRKLYYCL
ncbi:MAG: hypothetical protein IPP48_02510 [Chitinophagaceae bacterium]|nr:hypothetical protein [Chitinophagaceae bacterium]